MTTPPLDIAPKPRRILVNATSGIGQNLLAVPFLRALARVFPEAHVTAAVRFDVSRRLFVRSGYVDDVLVMNTRQYPGPRALFRLALELRRARFDMVFNVVPANHPLKNLLAYWTGAPLRIGHRYDHHPDRKLGFLLNRQVKVSHTVHDVVQNLNLLVAVGANVDAFDTHLEMWLTEEDEQVASSFLAERHLEDKPLLALHPGSSTEMGMDAKRWPASRFAEVARRLSESHGLVPLVLGGPDETALRDEVAQGCGGLSVEEPDLFRVASLIRRCRLMIANDSLTMHLAGAVGTPVLGIFGPTDPTRTAPWGPAGHVIRKPLPCSPCWNVTNIGRPFSCSNPLRLQCIDDLSVDQVLERVRTTMMMEST